MACKGGELMPISTDYLNPETQEYGYTGEAQYFQVPAGVFEILVECWGAASGDADYVAYGGYAANFINVSPGTILQVNVGGNDGFNGGGSRGTDNSGGGASDVRKPGSIGGAAYTYSRRQVIAGGAGGPALYQD